MSSIKLVNNPHGQSRWRVNFERNKIKSHKDYRELDDACREFYLAEIDRFSDMSPDEKEKTRDWSLRKLILFFIGKKVEQFEKNRIRLPTLETIKSILFSIDPDIQSKMALKVKPSDLRQLPELTLIYLNSAYRSLIELRGVGVSPVPKLSVREDKPLFIPAFGNVTAMISVARPREKIALILAAELGLRISEILALKYSDIRGDLLSVTKHITTIGMANGLKADIQRLLWVPDRLISLLDSEKKGTELPLIAGKEGGHLALSYSRNGIMKKLINEHEIGKFHNLRHFAAVEMLANGEDIAFVSRVLGHKNIEITHHIYGRFQSKVLRMKKRA